MMKTITQNLISKLSMIALLVCTSRLAIAHDTRNSSLRLLLPLNYEHTIVIDNLPYQGVYERFKIDELRAGNHRLKIVQTLVSRRGRVIERVVIYNGFVFIPKNSKVWARVYNNGRLMIEKTYQYREQHGRGNQNRGYDNRDYRHREYNQNTTDPRDDYYDDDWYGYNDQNDWQNDEGYSNRDRNYSENDERRDAETFGYTLSAIQKQSFDTDKLKIAKNAATAGNLSSAEIAQIAKLFSFESTRLEFAKFAYPYTTDPKNYVLVQDAFEFSSSISELQDFIAQYQGH